MEATGGGHEDPGTTGIVTLEWAGKEHSRDWTGNIFCSYQSSGNY